MYVRSMSRCVAAVAALALGSGCGGESPSEGDGGGGAVEHGSHGAAGGTSGHSHEDLEGTPVVLSDFAIAPAALTAPAGEIQLAVTNDGPTPHNLVIRDDAGEVLATTRILNPGEGETLTVTLPAGTYTTFCSLGGHESLGMIGTLTVE